MPAPQNWAQIVSYLEDNGYTPIAAAGIAGNIEQESGGDPEAQSPDGGGGLIQWTPTPAGYVTGHPGPDLQYQLTKIIAYNRGIGAGDIALLNKAKTPAQAAQIYMTDFEKPAAATANLANRQQSANATYADMQKGGVSTTSVAQGQGSGISTTGFGVSLNPVPWILSQLGVSDFTDLLERGALILLGAILIIVGILRFTSVSAPSAPKAAENDDDEEQLKLAKNVSQKEAETGESAGFERARNKDKNGKEDSAARARRYARKADADATDYSEVPF